MHFVELRPFGNAHKYSSTSRKYARAGEAWGHNTQRTRLGDAILDGVFNSDDFMRGVQASDYEAEAAAGWAEGDRDGDGKSTSVDLVAALADGGSERAPRVTKKAVPVSSLFLLVLLGIPA